MPNIYNLAWFGAQHECLVELKGGGGEISVQKEAGNLLQKGGGGVSNFVYRRARSAQMGGG